MNYDDTVDMINSVTRDIAAWDLKRNGYDPVDEGMIDDWIDDENFSSPTTYEINLTTTKKQFMSICKQYWDEYLEPHSPHH